MSKNSRDIARYHTMSGFTHLFLLVIIILVAIGAVGYLAYQNAQLKKPSEETTTPPTSTTTSTPLNPTTDWETYTNEELKFSFKYPNNFIVSEDKTYTDYATKQTEIIGFTIYWKGENEPIIRRRMYIPSNVSRFYDNDYQKILPKLLMLKEGESIEYTVGATSWKQKISRLANLKVAGIESYVFESPEAWEFPGIKRVIHIPKNNSYFLIDITYSNMPDRDIDYVEIFDQILSTFKFTE